MAKKIKKVETVSSQFNLSNCRERAQSKNYELVIENVKLAQLNAAYLSKIADLESNREEEEVEVKKEVQESESTEVLRHLNRISYLEMKLKNSDDKEAGLNGEIQNLEFLNR